MKSPRRLIVSQKPVTRRSKKTGAGSLEQFRALLDLGPELYFLIARPSGKVLDVNGSACERLGYSRNELLARTWEELLFLENPEASLPPTQWMAALENHDGRSQRVQLCSRNHPPLWVDLTVHSREFAGEPQALLLARDITEQVHAETRREADLQKYRTLFESATSALFLETVEGKILDCNTIASELYGYPHEELLTLAVADLVSETVLEQLPEIMAARLNQEGILIESVGRRSDGSTFPIEVSAQLIQIEGVPRVLTHIQDISLRKQAETALQRRDAILEAVSFAAAQFLKTSRWESSIREVLARLGSALKVSRAYILQNDRADETLLTARQRYVWLAPGLPPRAPDETRHGTPIELRLLLELTDPPHLGQILARNVRDLPPELQTPLSARGIHSLLLVPIFVDEDWWGIFGFDECAAERDWSPIEVEALKTAASTLGAAIQRAQSEETLRFNETRLEALWRLSQMTESSVQEILDFVVEEAVQITESRIGYLAFLDPAETQLTISAWSRRVNDLCQIKDLQHAYRLDQAGLWSEAVRQRRPIVTNHYTLAAPYKKGHPEGHIPLDRHLSVPVFDGESIVALLGVANSEREYDGVDIRQLGLLLDGMWRMIRKKQTDAALQESEARYRILFEQANDAIFLEDETDAILDVNRKACELLGHSREELLRMKVGELIAPEFRRGQGPIIQEEIRQYEDRPFESINLHRDGRRIPVEVTTTRILGQDRAVVLAIVRDITERKQAEEEIHRLKEFNEELIQNIAEGIVVEDRDGYFMFANPAAAAMMGYTPQELIGRHWITMVPPDQWPKVRLSNERRARGEMDRYELTLLRQDSSRLPILASSTPRFRNGVFDGALVVLTDISERARIEEEKSQFLERMQRQRIALMQLSTHPALTENRLPAWFPLVCKTAAETFALDRVSLWQFSSDGQELQCREAYRRCNKDSRIGRVIASEFCPGYFAALRSGQILEIQNVHTDARTVELSSNYWHLWGIQAVLIAPVRLYGKIVGIISYEHAGTPRLWTPDEVMFGGQLADLVAQAYLNADLRRRADELAAITRVSREITSIPDLQPVLDLIALHAAQLSHSDASGVFIVQPDKTLRIVTGYGVQPDFLEALRGEEIRIGQGVMGRAVARRGPIQVTDVQAEPYYTYRHLGAMEWVRSVLAVPMLHGNDVRGGIVLWHRQPRHFSDQEVEFIQALAQQCVNAVQNAQLFTAERQARERTEALYQASRVIGEATSFQGILQGAAEIAGSLGYTGCALFRISALDEQARPLRLSVYPTIRLETGWQKRSPIEDIPLTDVVDFNPLLQSTDFIKVYPDLEATRNLVPEAIREKSRAIGVNGIVIAGLSLHGYPQGFLAFSSHQPLNSLPEETIRRMRMLAEQVAVALENLRLLQETQHSARRMEALYKVSRTISSSLEEDTLIRTILESIYHTLSYEYITLATVDEETRTIGVRHGIWQGEFDSFPEWLHLAQFPLTHPDIMADIYRTGQTEIIGSWDPRFSREIWDKFNHEQLLRIFTPIKMRQRIIGVIEAGYNKQQKAAIDDEEVQMLMAFADQAAVALENARLFTSLTQEKGRLELLYRLARRISERLALHDVAQRALSELCTSLEKTRGYILTAGREEPRLQLIAAFGYEDYDLGYLSQQLNARLEPGLSDWVLKHQETAVVVDVIQDPRWQILQELDGETRSSLAVPLLSGDHELGVLVLGNAQPGFFSEQHRRLVESAAMTIAIALSNARLFEQAQVERVRLATLYAASRVLAGARTLEEAAQAALEIAPYLGAQHGDLILLNQTGAPQFYSNLPDWNTLPLHAIQEFIHRVVRDGIQGWVLTHRQSARISETHGDPRWLTLPQYPPGEEVRSVICTPLFNRDGEIIGLLNYTHPQPQAFGPEEQRLAEEIAVRVAVTLENAQLFEETRRRAFEQEAVSRIARACNALEVQAAIPILVEELHALSHCEEVILSLLDENRTHYLIIAMPGGSGPFWSSGTTLPVAVVAPPPELAAGRPYWIADLVENPNAHLPYEQTLSEAGFRAVVILPLLAGGQLLGMLNLASKTPGFFKEEQLPTLRQVADVLAGALEKSHFFQAEQRRRQEAETLRETALALTTALDRNEVIERILAQLQAVVPYDSASVQLLREGYFEIVGGRGFPNLFELLGMTFPLTGDNPNAEVVRTRAPVIVAQAQAHYIDFQQEPHARARIQSWMGVPMLSGERLIGMIALDKHEAAFYLPEHAELAQAFAAQAAIAMENSRLFQEAQQRAEALATLHESAVAMASILSVEQVLHTLAERMGTLLDTTSVYIADWSQDHNRCRVLTRWWGQDALEPERQSDWGQIYYLECYPTIHQGLQNKYPIVLQQSELAPETGEWEEARKYGWQSSLLVPLVVRDGVIGYIALWESRGERHFTRAEIQLAQTMAADAAVALEHARLFQAERKQRLIAQALSEAAAAVSSTLNKEIALGRILEQVARIMPARGFNLMQIDEYGQVSTTQWHGYADQTLEPQAFPLDQYPVLEIMNQTGQPLFVEDTAGGSNWRAFPGLPPTQAYLGVPIRASRVTVGFLNVDDPEHLDPADLPHLEAFANQAATAIQNAALFKELRDYTELLEQRVQERTAQIKAQYARLEAVLSSTADGIIVTGSEGEILLANPVAQEWLVQKLIPEDALQLRTALDELARHAAQRPEKVLELKGLDLQLNVAPISEPGSEGATAVVAVHDVSFLKALDRMKSQFISNISHELRTPITVIQLYTSLLRQAPPERRELYLDILERESQRQARLVEDILQISRIEAGRLEISPTPTSINQLVQMVYNSHQFLAQMQGVTLEIDLAEWDPIAWVDPDRATQMLNNLVENAIRYTTLGGQVLISTGIEEIEGRTWARFAVSDTGIGIPAEELEHIFERFYRGEEARERQIPGTGLGLAIVKDLVELHGGRMQVESQVGVGSTFQIWLLYREASEKESGL